MKLKQLILKKNKEFSLLNAHPWVYAQAFKEIPASLKTGDMVEVFTHKNELISRGYVDLGSPILVRILKKTHHKDIETQIQSLLTTAIDLRKDFFNNPAYTNAYRVFNGEGDGIPGLVIDKYADTISLQFYSSGLDPFLSTITSAIKKNLPEIKYILKLDNVKHAKTGNSAIIYGKKKPQKTLFMESGLNYSTDLIHGQKTGFFLDQRLNRELIRKIAKNKTLLNICGYTGAFTVAALAGGATSSVTVDIAQPALDEAKNNLILNKFDLSNNHLICSDMYEFLSDAKFSQLFDLVVLDPPSMAKSRRDLEKALRAYRRLNELAVKRVAPGGYFFTASCSSHVTYADFLEMIKGVAAKSKRFFRIVNESFHSFDHPVNLAHPEGKYLKGLLLKLD